MPFTAAQLAHAANAALEFHMDKGTVYSQSIQDRPLLRCLEEKSKTFPGGKDNLTVRVKGVYSASHEGFEADDTVTYSNPTNIREATYAWKLHHTGINFSKHELLKDGISIVDEKAADTVRHSDREETMLANILDDKLEDLSESRARGNNTVVWGDGTADPKKAAGIRSFILEDPTSATVVGGIDQSANTWWRNRADVAITLGDTTGESQAVINKLQNEFRQLRRYGGRPNKAMAGSDFLDRMEKELRFKGNYTDEGWQGKRRIDPAIPDLAFKRVPFEYDPTLDDLGLSKRVFVFDDRDIKMMPIEGEYGQIHSPERPEDKYVYYRAITDVYGVTCRRRNSSGVYGFA